MTQVDIAGTAKRFGSVTALSELNLCIEHKEFVAILGPSGCGKTTLLMLLAGLYAPSSGEIRFDGFCVNEVEARHRNIGIVFQSYALYPHMNVRENIGFPLRYRSVSKTEANRRVDEAAALVQIKELMERKPAEMSGGQQQRVALARALVKEPGLLLLDEPLSNLDAALRIQMRTEIARLHKALGVTTVLVTHDQSEALMLADRIVVMNAGRIEQIGSPDELHDKPASLFVARFVGHPPMSVVPAERRDGHVFVAGVDLGVAPDTPGDLKVGLRPEGLLLGGSALPGTVLACERHGRDACLTVETQAGLLSVLAEWEQSRSDPGTAVRLDIGPGAVVLFSAADGKRIEWDAHQGGAHAR